MNLISCFSTIFIG